MTQLTIDIPDDINKELEAIATRAGVSINVLFSRTVTELVQQLRDRETMREELGKADALIISAYLDRVPDGPVLPTDQLPED